MSFYNTQDSPNFSVYPSRDQRAPYGTVHNIPIIQAIDNYAFDTLPVTLMQDGTFLILQGNYPVLLPPALNLFRYFGGHKYISNGDIQQIQVINRATDPDFPWVEFVANDENSSSWSAPGTCDCLVIQWTTTDEGGNQLPENDVYYTILPSSAFPLDLSPQLQAKKEEFKAKLASRK